VNISVQFHKYLHTTCYVIGINIILSCEMMITESLYPGNNDKLHDNTAYTLGLISSMISTADNMIYRP